MEIYHGRKIANRWGAVKKPRPATSDDVLEIAIQLDRPLAMPPGRYWYLMTGHFEREQASTEFMKTEERVVL